MRKLCILLFLITYAYHNARYKECKLFGIYVAGDAEGVYTVVVIMLTDLVTTR